MSSVTETRKPEPAPFRSDFERMNVTGCHETAPPALQFTPGASFTALVAALASRIQMVRLVIKLASAEGSSAGVHEDLVMIVWPLADELQLIVEQLQRAPELLAQAAAAANPAGAHPGLSTPIHVAITSDAGGVKESEHGQRASLASA